MNGYKIPGLRTWLPCALALAAVARAGGAGPDGASVSAGLTSEGGRIVVEAKGMPAPAPLFFSVSAEETVRLGAGGIAGEIRLKIHVLQGRAQVITLGLSGDGVVTDVSGAGLRDWGVRRTAGARFLDLRPAQAAEGDAPHDLQLVVLTLLEKPQIPGTAAVLIPTPGDAAGFSLGVELRADADIDLRVTSASGLVAIGDDGGSPGPTRFMATGEGRIEALLAERGAAQSEAELSGARLSGRLAAAGASVDFRLTGQFRVGKAGSRLRILSGRAALSGAAGADGWHAELVALGDGRFAYDLVGERAGLFALDLAFAAPVTVSGDWHALDFAMPAGSVVPLRLEGLGAGVAFDPRLPIVPTADQAGWQGFLPADGRADLSWKPTHAAEQGALFFTSSEQSDVRIGGGLMRQSSRVALRVLQGRLGGFRCRLEGPGQILGVEGTNVVGWTVVAEGAARILDVRFSRPVESEGSLTVNSQSELGGFPERAEPLRLLPEGVVRHSGFVRVANSGSVRLEVADVAGMMQLAPAQFPGPAAEAQARQVFVYRFPSADYSYRVVATEIEPEVGVSEVSTYELSETDRVIDASLELDVREAPLRDWSVQIPDDFTVASVEGGGVSDYVAETAAAGGYRNLKVLFGGPVEGRQLLRLRLERSQQAAAGAWQLRPLRFPGAKSVQGHIGAVSTPGYRIVPTGVQQLAEVPLSYFPRQTAGLQQAWRIRAPQWSADLRVEALGQSIQADVFHLYSIKEGIVYGSVLVNYFVVGAPSSQWRIHVPASVGNIDVVGENVQRDWRREGDQVIVSLHQPVLGAATLLITFEQPMSARGGLIEPGQVRPLGVQAERGYIEVVSPLQVKFAVRKFEGGLLRLEPAELPAEFRLLSASPALAVYQYTERPFGLEMGIEWYTPAETADQVVDFAKLSSQVSRDGQVVTDAQYFVKTHGRKALRMAIPEGVKLWEARVDNEVTNAQVDGDQTLIPLPARANANEPVSVALRLGQAAGGSGSAVSLRAPRMAASTVIAEWTLHGDPGLVLVPEGGNSNLVHPALTESGFEWISERGSLALAALLGVVLLGALFLLSESRWQIASGLACCIASMLAASMLAADALINRRANLHELTYSSTVVSSLESVSIRVANVGEWRAMLVWWGVGAGAAGAIALVAALVPSLRGRPLSRVAGPTGAVLLSIGLLAQHGGAVPFFGAACVAVFIGMFIPGAGRWQGGRPAIERAGPAAPGPGAAPAGSILGIALAAGLALGSPWLRAESAPPAPAWLPVGTKAAQTMVENWSVRGNRLFADVELTVRGESGDSFLLLRPPAALTEFAGDGLRVGKVERGGETSYYVAAERAGTLGARVRFEMPVGDLALGIAVPTGPAASQRISVELDQGGWEFSSQAAVQILPKAGLGDGRSGATLVLEPQGDPRIALRPRRRDVASEATEFFAEVSNLYVPGPGVVDGFARVTIRPVQGRVAELELDVPKGLTVGDVLRGPVGSWRFDPKVHRLHVTMEPARADTFGFDVVTQLGAGALPFGLSLEPLRVAAAAGQVGTLAVAFGPEAQPESFAASGMSPVNAGDFDTGLVPRARDGQPAAVVEQVWRYGQSGGSVGVKVVAVAPEVRVAGRQVLSLGDDRMVMAVDLSVSISRAGLFRLSFPLPEGLDVEALSGPALSQWTEAEEAGQRIVTMHLNGRTMGEKTFSLTLGGAAPRAQEAWPVPRVVIREAGRQTGEALLVPGKGLRLRVADRSKVTQIDPISVGGLQPGTLAFRLLEGDWGLRVGIEALEPWVTVQALEEVTVREGQTLTRIGLRCRVENAAVKQLRIRLPGLGEERARTVRATGSAVSDMVRVPGSGDIWEVRFQRGIAGETDVQVEFQGPAVRDAGREEIEPPEFPGARQVAQFVAVRGGGRLELEAENLPRGWARADWGSVAANLQARSDSSVPALCFRVAEPERALAVTVVRHDIAGALNLRVTEGDLTTVFSLAGASLTSVDLKLEVLEKSTMRVRLPEGARLFNTFVNGDSVSVVRDADSYLFHVASATGADRMATVRLVYAAPGTGGGVVALAGPSLSVPLENVAWRIVIPPGLRLVRYSGALQLRDDRTAGMFGIEEYRSLVDSARSANARKAVAMLDEANSFLQSGDQQRAGEMFSRASNAQLDEASNEDARVQLRILKTQQTMLGLNTRRQRLYLDNRVEGPRNEQLEQAASLNPFMLGKVNFDPQQVDQLLMGNTAEENAALRGIAARLVDQQLLAEPAPGAIDLTLPEPGRVLTFTRSLQVDGESPLELRLVVGTASDTSLRFCLLVLATIAAICALPSRRVPGAPGAHANPAPH